MEAAFTQPTLVWAVAHTHVHPLVCLQVTLDGKAPAADVTLEWLDAGVCAEVEDQR